MISPITIFQEGGPFMYVILWAGMGNAVLAVAYLSVAMRRRAPAWLVLVPALLPMLLGVLGSQFGLILATAAVARASAETKLILMANGIHVASFTTLGALLVNLEFLGLATLGAWIGVVRRWSAPPDEALATRTAATVLLLTLLGTLAVHTVVAGEAGAFGAVAMASAETKQALIARAVADTQQTLLGLAGAGAVGLLVGLAMIAPVARAGTRRTWVGAGASLGVAAILLTLPLLSRGIADAQALIDEQKALEEAPYVPLRELNIDLATTDDCLWGNPRSHPRVSMGADGIQVSGLWAGEPAGPIQDGLHWTVFEKLDALASTEAQATPAVTYSGELVADFSGDARWETVRPVLAAAAAARFGKVRLGALREARELCFVESALAGPVHPSAGTRATKRPEPDPLADRFLSIDIEQPQGEPVVVRRAIGEPVPDEATVVELVPDPDTTMQAIIDAVAELSAFRKVVLVTSGPADE